MTNGERWKMVLEVDWLIAHLMKRWAIPLEQRDDVRQVAREWLFKKAHRYDPAISKWPTYARWIISSAARSYTMQERMFGPMNYRDSPAKRCGMLHAERTDRSFERVEDGIVSRQVELVLQQLHPLEREALLGRARDETFAEIGQRVGCSRQALAFREQQAIERARALLRRQSLARLAPQRSAA